jgi:hypothetical protein
MGLYTIFNVNFYKRKRFCFLTPGCVFLDLFETFCLFRFRMCTCWEFLRTYVVLFRGVSCVDSLRCYVTCRCDAIVCVIRVVSCRVVSCRVHSYSYVLVRVRIRAVLCTFVFVSVRAVSLRIVSICVVLLVSCRFALDRAVRFAWQCRADLRCGRVWSRLADSFRAAVCFASSRLVVG